MSNREEKYMKKTSSNILTENLELVTENFWQVDCLIRIMKEILTNQNWETQEEDIETICKILIKNSEILHKQIKTLKLEIEN